MSVWDDVAGQPEVVAQLREAVAIPAAMTHAWLFTGPPGSGRSTAARAFAAALQCEVNDDGAVGAGGPGAERGCGVCHACRTVLAGTHADVQVVATEKLSIGVDDVRALVQRAARAPSAGRWRVVLVEDADRFTEHSANTLLKSIEEPPPRTVWLLCAPSPEDMVTTIQSRCRPVRLRVPSVEDVAALLVRRDGIDPTMAAYAARAAQSHVGLARRLARDEGARLRRRQVLQLAFEVTGVGEAVVRAGELVDVASEEATAATAERDAAERADLLRSLGAEAAGSLPPALRSQVKALEDDQKKRATRAKRDVLDRALVDLASLYRDVLVVQLGAGVDLVNAELGREVAGLARRGGPEQTLARLDAIATARRRISANVNPLLAVEAMALALRP
ncbi:DNA polymerase-3 subunit delta' [Quadrisphaera granulorum]|uniref:DNA polymerase-3 subunit delta n=1 Tax=Quadrisphaera granulorum TaxID=317664 RepID=A0A316A6J9_9ACTN|nr:DNA polymerase III subunit delta' [Quadrisphaera granulorum]PWJ53325.1 DNA polymerase-3 subunit delta' [Quadrisphaera granulorum]SZE96999.1 DNA polymerase-3 subunit delta' [Quadrisphaera granulorum]